MIRLALLVTLVASSSAFAQTADVIQEITGLLDNLRHRSGPTATVTYDVSKLVKANPDLNSADKVLARLTDRGLILAATGKGGLGDAVTILPKNRIAVRTYESVHERIQDQLDWWQKPAEKKAALDAALPNVRAGGLPLPKGLRADIRDALLNPPKKKKK